MTILPIPSVNIVDLELYFLEYHITSEYKNKKLSISINISDRVDDLRNKIEKLYGIERSSYIIARVFDKSIESIYNTHTVIR